MKKSMVGIAVVLLITLFLSVNANVQIDRLQRQIDTLTQANNIVVRRVDELSARNGQDTYSWTIEDCRAFINIEGYVPPECDLPGAFWE